MPGDPTRPHTTQTLVADAWLNPNQTRLARRLSLIKQGQSLTVTRARQAQLLTEAAHLHGRCSHKTCRWAKSQGLSITAGDDPDLMRLTLGRFEVQATSRQVTTPKVLQALHQHLQQAEATQAYAIEQRAARAIAELEWVGVPLDVTRLENLREEALRLGSHGNNLLRAVTILETHATNGRVYPRWSHHHPSGKLYAREPNLQSLPSRHPIDRRVREAIAPEADRVLIVLDANQLELRLLAELSGDERLHNTLSADGDLHLETAARVYGIAHPNPAQRAIGKAVNYAILYGASRAPTSLDLPPLAFERARAELRQRFRTAFSFLESAQHAARQTGLVRDAFNRRVPCRPHAAGHALIASSAAGILKRSLAELHDTLPPKTHTIMAVHDELVIETDRRREAEVRTLAELAWRAAWPGQALPARIETRKRWLE